MPEKDMIDLQVNNFSNHSAKYEPLPSRGSRKVIKSSKASSRGMMTEYCNSDRTPRLVQYESKLEQRVYFLLRLEDSVLDIQEQFPVVSFRDGKGKMRTHVFDFCLTLQDGRKTGIVVKSARATRSKRLFDDLHAIRQATPTTFLADIVLITDQDISKTKALNAERLHRYGRGLNATFVKEVRKRLNGLRKNCTVAEFLIDIENRHLGFAALLYLLLKNELQLDPNLELEFSSVLTSLGETLC